jgi:hypothetical protein
MATAKVIFVVEPVGGKRKTVCFRCAVKAIASDPDDTVYDSVTMGSTPYEDNECADCGKVINDFMEI